jgi:16S rRNA (uracil1498-N3)-methyltransferase
MRARAGSEEPPIDDAAPARYRFFVEEPPEGGETALHGDLAHRVARVLRLPVGTEVSLFDGSGRSWPATLTAVESRRVLLTVGRPVLHAPASTTVLLAGMIRPNRFEWLIEKATELGATALLPAICARSAVRPAEVGRARLERWRRLGVEAAEQCGRVTVPDLHPPIPFDAALEACRGRSFVASEPAHGAAPPLGTALNGVAGDPVTILTGPEGGLTPAEVERAVAAGARAVSLGPLVLRAETAAIAALSILVDARGRSGTAPP